MKKGERTENRDITAGQNLSARRKVQANRSAAMKLTFNQCTNCWRSRTTYLAR